MIYNAVNISRMNRQCLENVSSNKLLGITNNHNLPCEEDVNSIVKMINSKLDLLRGIKGFLPLESRKMFSNAYILPHMDYSLG